MKIQSGLVPVSVGCCVDGMTSHLQQVHWDLERSRAHGCQWLLRLFPAFQPGEWFHFVNIPQENAHQISGHVTSSLWAWLLICRGKWWGYKAWPRGPLPQVTPHGASSLLEVVVTMAEKWPVEIFSFAQQERSLQGPEGLHTSISLFVQINIWHCSMAFLLKAPSSSVCVLLRSPFFKWVQQPECSPTFYLSISHF